MKVDPDDIRCQLLSPGELVEVLRSNEKVSFSDERSRMKLIEWLETFVRFRDVIYETKECLAKAELRTPLPGP